MCAPTMRYVGVDGGRVVCEYGECLGCDSTLGMLFCVVQVNGFPTLIMYNNGVSIGEHQGSRDLVGLESFIQTKTRDEL